MRFALGQPVRGNPVAALLLADGRFPAGGHAHSGGVEQAVADGRIHDLASLKPFLLGRLVTVGLVDAALAAATLHRYYELFERSPSVFVPPRVQEPPTLPAYEVRVRDLLEQLDAEAEARIAPLPLRMASRRQGRQLIRAAARCWRIPFLDAAAAVAPTGLHQAVALGLTGAAANLSGPEVAHLAVHHAVMTPAQAAVRLLGLDPYAVVALGYELYPEIYRVVADAVAAAWGPVAELPAGSGPLLDIAAIEHDQRDARLFVT